MITSIKKYVSVPFVSGFIIVAFFSFYKLTESPPVWMDEGIITQVAENMTLHHTHAIQTAPDTFSSAWYATTAFPVTLPISIVFSLFGTSLLSARLVMVAFILLLYISTYFLLKKNEIHVLVLSLLFLATFAPLYGHGKSVLGEVPGLAFFVTSLVFLNKVVDAYIHKRLYVLGAAGLFLGLAIVTKPLFILVIPAAIVALYAYRKHLFADRFHLTAFLCAGAVPLIVWLFIQFAGTALTDVVGLYSNPNNVSVSQYIALNLKRFVTEPQVFYALVLFLLWTLSIIVRQRRKITITVSEVLAWTFSLLVYLAYLRTIGFYRYFFIPEVLSVIYVISSISVFQKIVVRRLLYVFFGLLIISQCYQLMYRSWVADHYQSARGEQLQVHLGRIAPGKTVFFYQVPEAVVFLNSSLYYQYFAITPALRVGEDQLEVLTKGIPDFVVTSRSLDTGIPLFNRYHVVESFDRYQILAQ